MKTHKNKQNQDGVALIMVLGLLAVMTVLSVAFSIAMRVERLAARNFAHAVRAEQLIQTAMVRSVGDINGEMVGQVYPDWRQRNQNYGEGLLPSGDPVTDAMCSHSGNVEPVPDILAGEAMRSIPHALLDHAAAMSPDWIEDGITNGRIAYVVINASGLLDANYVGGTNRVWSKHPNEIDISSLPEVISAPTFYADRRTDVRYETIPELGKLNTGVGDPISNLVVFSFDVAKDQFFVDTGNQPTEVDTNRPPRDLGRRTAVLRDKFYINSITNYQAYYNPGVYTAYKNSQALYGENFIGEYWQHMRDMLEVAGLERPDDVSWNLINYLDPDRVPQGAEDYPWRHTEGGEAIPLINEIVLQEVDMPGGMTNIWVGTDPRDPSQGYWTNVLGSGGPGYRFAIELWYPFAPIDVEPQDGFSLQVGVFDEQFTAPNELAIMRWARTNWSFRASINNMEYGTATEFLVITSPVSKTITFPPNSTTDGAFAPIGSTDPDRGNRPNVVYFLARVLKAETNNYGAVVATNPVDEAMGYQMGELTEYRRALKRFDQPRGFSVNDPRSNGQVKYWSNFGDNSRNIDGFDYPPDQNTLGGTNANCDPWSFKGQGLPLYAKNGIMLNVGELGHIFRSNLDDEANTDYWYWRNINLMRSDEGAMLLDLMTVDPEVEAKRGLFCINSWQRDAMLALFNNLEIGVSNVVGANRFRIPQPSIDDLVDTIIAERDRRNRPFLSYADLFTTEDSDEGGGGPVADAFRECAPRGPDSNDIYKEDTFRHICELISFRNNIYIILMVAQATQDLPNGDKSILAERRAMATVYRDSYTGRHFTRSFKWLTD